MTPRRLLPFLLVFIVLALTYFFTQWQEATKARQEKEAKRLFQVSEGDITEVSLKRGKEEIRVVKKDRHWEMAAPLKSRADQVTMESVLSTLSSLNRERDLKEPQDLGPFGLTSPGLVLELKAAGKSHRLLIGGKIPGDKGYYVLIDQDPRVYIINTYNKESLDRPLAAWRDKTLFEFAPDQVKAVQFKVGSLKVNLEKTGPGSWRWSGRDMVKVRRDRLESFLRQLTLTRIQDFINDHPKEVKAYGLAPQPAAELALILEKGQYRLSLGARKNKSQYAWKGPGTPVVLVDQDLMKRTQQLLASLEDRRLWSGEISEVQKVVWGAPPKLWTALREKDFWKLTGPGQEDFRQPAARLEMALWKFQDLEYDRLSPAAPGSD